MAITPGRHALTVAAEEAGLRLDIFLSRRAPGLSRSAASRLIREERVRASGKRAKPGLLLAAGELVELDVPEPAGARALPEDLPLTILYEDDDLAVIDKPAGIVTHPAAGHDSGTLVNALLHHLKNLSGIGGELRPGIVHRLDKDTSGLLLVAKSDRAHHALSSGIQERRITRRYEAVVWGHPAGDQFTLETRLGRDPKARKRFAVVAPGRQGKTAITHFQVLRRFSEFTLMQLRLETGRTHQIRVHCRHLNLPVVGDREYGKRGEASQLQKLGLPRPERQLLHAVRLEFSHPLTGQPMAFASPYPADFSEFLNALES